MALLTCPDCDGPVSSRAPACPRCGAPVAADGPKAAAARPPPSGASMPLEILTHGGMSTLPLNRPVTVGRSKANILVEHQDVAATHCRVEPLDDGWRVVDLSDKGVWLSGAQVAVADIRAGEVADLGGFPGAVALALPCALAEGVPLKLKVPGQPDQALVMLKLPMVIGRASWVDLPLADRNVSHVHARLRMDAGRVVADDLGSRNGTWVNGARVRTGCELRHGDRLLFGDTELVFGQEFERPTVEPAVKAPGAGDTAPFAIPEELGASKPAAETVKAFPDVVLPSGLSLEQLAGSPDQHVGVPVVRNDVTQLLRIDTDACPACGDSFFLTRPGVVTSAMRLAVRRRHPQASELGRCSSCGARVALCAQCQCPNTVTALFEAIHCRRCGDSYSAG